MGVPGRDRLQKIGQTSGCTPKIQSSCAVKAIGPIVVCCLELRFDAASAPGEPCGPGSSILFFISSEKYIGISENAFQNHRKKGKQVCGA